MSIAPNTDLVNITNNGATDIETDKPYATISTVISSAKFATIINLVAHCITNNVDPVDYIAYSNGNYSIVNPAGLNKMVFTGNPINLNLTNVGGEITYVFRGTANQSYTINLSSANGTGSIKLFNPNNSTMVASMTSGMASANSSLTFTASSNGTHRIITNASTVGTFTLSVTQNP